MSSDVSRGHPVDDALVVKSFEGAPFRPGPVSYAAAIARDGSRLAVVSGLGLALFDGDGALVATRPIDPSSTVSFGASGALLLASDVYSGVVGVFDASTLERRATIAPPKPFATDVFPSPTHAHLALFACGEFATVWNIETGVIERELPLCDGSTPRYTSDACFSPDGTSVAVVESGALSVWDLRSGEQRARVALSSTVLRIASARDGARWFGASSDGRLLAFDARSCELVADAPVLGTACEPTLLAVSADGERLVCVSTKGAVIVASSATLAVEKRVELGVHIRRASIASDGATVVLTDGEFRLRRLSLAEGDPVVRAAPERVSGLVFDGESTVFVRHGSKRRKLVIDGAGSESDADAYAVTELLGRPQRSAGTLLFHRGAVIQTLDWRTGAPAEYAAFDRDVFVGALACQTSDGGALAGAMDRHGYARGEPQRVAVAQRSSAKRATVVVLDAARWRVEALALSPSGARLAVADADGTIRVFDVERAFGATKGKKTAKKRAKS